jgi:hypothetical protein
VGGEAVQWCAVRLGWAGLGCRKVQGCGEVGLGCGGRFWCVKTRKTSGMVCLGAGLGKGHGGECGEWKKGVLCRVGSGGPHSRTSSSNSMLRGSHGSSEALRAWDLSTNS